MRRHRERLIVMATIALGVLAAAALPLWMWRDERGDAIDSEFDSWLVGQMEEVQRTHLAGSGEIDFDAWEVNIDDQWTRPLSENTTLEPPLFTWMRDTGEGSSFRDYAVDETSFRAYVLPVRPGYGFVTLLDTWDRDRQHDDLAGQVRLLALAALVLALVVGWIASAIALGPSRRALADQQGFLADAAHEMRTPLAVILASSSQALARSRSEEEYVRSLSEIRGAAERASAGVNELLELVRFESGQAIPRLAPLRLDLLAEEVAAAVRTDDCAVVAEPTAAVVVQADMPLLRQALDNVVRNAVRRSTRVELTTTRVGRDGVVTVTDNGPGFAPDMVAHVFDRYRRGDRNGEVGLGLSIVRAIVSAHGGEVSARNAPPDASAEEAGGSSGAIVEIRIPLAAPGV